MPIASLEAVAKLLQDAQLNYDDALMEAQRGCSHPRVGHAEWRNFEHGGYLPCLRVCLECGLEEQGTLWSDIRQFSEKDHGTCRLGNAEGRDILLFDRDQLYAKRRTR